MVYVRWTVFLNKYPSSPTFILSLDYVPIIFDTKMGWATFLGDFSTNSSGRPVWTRHPDNTVEQRRMA
jgi:hypothetical protein